jgi:hypothetical protein
MHGRLVYKDIFGSIIRDDKAETLLDVKPLDGTVQGGKEAHAGAAAASHCAAQKHRFGEDGRKHDV